MTMPQSGKRRFHNEDEDDDDDARQFDVIVTSTMWKVSPTSSRTSPLLCPCPL